MDDPITRLEGKLSTNGQIIVVQRRCIQAICIILHTQTERRLLYQTNIGAQAQEQHVHWRVHGPEGKQHGHSLCQTCRFPHDDQRVGRRPIARRIMFFHQNAQVCMQLAVQGQLFTRKMPSATSRWASGEQVLRFCQGHRVRDLLCIPVLLDV